ncbi:FKBP-type peptidyl-prolyl cis-trans isomerase [Mucilaginibacter sp.]|uniref:FKBP-type peptidyl-prolyl cis-trans isomerase n=1 Tax=Mucilaginibacter sp. TaxID=1882438 RepID=UPI003B00A62A
MKQFAFAFLAILVLAMFSCKKDYQTISSYDDQTIQSYISANHLTMMAGDSGIYYHIIKPGDTGNPLTDTDRIFYAFTVKTLDGKYISTDTVLNRVANYVGSNLTTLPFGLQYGLKKYLQRRNGIIQLLIPSKQAYGVSGFPSAKIPGNESLDYTVYLYNADSQLAYDTIQIRNYIKKNNLTGFKKTVSGLYYQILDGGSGKDQIYSTSSVTVTLNKGVLKNGTTTVVETTSPAAQNVGAFNSAGVREGLQKINSGGKIRLLIPSDLGYGKNPASATAGDYNYKIPPASILDYTINVTAVTN